jgi:hypothetical protein
MRHPSGVPLVAPGPGSREGSIASPSSAGTRQGSTIVFANDVDAATVAVKLTGCP